MKLSVTLTCLLQIKGSEKTGRVRKVPSCDVPEMLSLATESTSVLDKVLLFPMPVPKVMFFLEILVMTIETTPKITYITATSPVDPVFGSDV